MQRVLTAFAAAAFAFTSTAFAQTEISLEDVPSQIIETAETTVPGVTFHRVSSETEGGVLIYEFEAYNSAGKHIEVDITENGDLQELEMEIDFAQVPANIKTALEETAPGFEPTYVEYSVRDGGRDYVYEFEGDHNGRALEIEIAESGRVLFASDGSVG